MQTDTGIVIVREGQLIRVSAQELRETATAETPTGSHRG
jgi:hypothetical protein